MKKLLLISLLLLLTSCGSNEIIPTETTTSAETSPIIQVSSSDTSITLTDTVRITEAGTYVIDGTLSDGQIIIDANKNDIVTLVLNGVSITSSASAPIYTVKAAETVIILADGTENHITDTATSRTNDPDAAIFAKSSLTITGGGNLYVTGNHNHGINTKGALVIEGGTITVAAANDGLHGRDGISIMGGTFKITAANDGIQSNSSLFIGGGSFDIKTGGGSSNAPIRQENFRGWGWDNLVPEEETDTESMKAIKAAASITIENGEFIIDSEDDAFHADGDFTITNGNFTISTGDDAIHSGNELRIDGGTINILTSYEGLEGISVDINGGVIMLKSQDDGINAAGGSDDESHEVNSNAYIRVSGGTLAIDADGDGIDSNGKVYFDGGDVVISGPTESMNSALDSETGIEINGGNVIAAGSSGMLAIPSASSAQAVIVVYYTQNQAADTEIRLIDANGDVVASYKPKKMYQSAIISAEQLEIGGVYTLYSDNAELCEITLSSNITTISDDGSAVTARQNGGFGGMNPGGGNRPPMNQRPNT